MFIDPAIDHFNPVLSILIPPLPGRVLRVDEGQVLDDRYGFSPSIVIVRWPLIDAPT